MIPINTNRNFTRTTLTRIALLVLALGFAAAAFAHGDKKHILGTVTKVDSTRIVVETRDHKTVEVAIVPGTTFRKDGKEAKLADISLGDRVSIHARPKAATLEAAEIQIGAPAPLRKPKP